MPRSLRGVEFIFGRMASHGLFRDVVLYFLCDDPCQRLDRERAHGQAVRLRIERIFRGGHPMDIDKNHRRLKGFALFADSNRLVFWQDPCSRGPIAIRDIGKCHIPYFSVQQAPHGFRGVFLKIRLAHNPLQRFPHSNVIQFGGGIRLCRRNSGRGSGFIIGLPLQACMPVDGGQIRAKQVLEQTFPLFSG